MPAKLLLDDWIRRIESRDANVFEDAYFGTRPSGPDVLAGLIEALRRATDSYTRGKFCELLGEMGDTSALPVLQEEIDHPERGTADWAAKAIDMLQSPALRAAHREHLRQMRVDDGFEK